MSPATLVGGPRARRGSLPVPPRGGRRPPTGRRSSPPPRKRRGPPPSPRRRLIALLVVLVVVFAVVAGRLVLIQGLAADRYATFGRSQRFHSVVLPAQRGSIFDRNGADLALSTRRRTVWADPTVVRDPAGAARALAPVLGKPEAELRDRLSANAAFVYLARKVPDPVADQVEALRLAGVSLLDEPQRVTPAAPLANGVLGHVGLDNEGLSGLELQYEKDLAGQAGQLVFERDPEGRAIASGLHELRAPTRGDHLTLTIDRSLQYETERVLAEQIVATRAKAGVALIMDPHSGEILAMANLRAGTGANPPAPTPDNMAVTNVYEPGSVNKLITVAGAIEEGLVRPSDTFVVPDKLEVAGGTFHDSSPHETQRMTTSEIVAQSSNVGTIMIGRKLKKEGLDRYLRAFGLGDRTDLRFPGESPGLLLDPEEWSGTSMATVPIGQGMAVTALQMLLAYNVIANDGTYVAPTLVKSVVDANGDRRAPRRAPARRVVSIDTARQVKAILEQAVADGTGEAAQVPGYSVAGKTGTAEKPRVGGRGYEQGAYVATFAGFLPASAPRLSAIVVLDEPTPFYGGLASAPVFSRLATFGIRLLRVSPDAPIGPVTSLPAATEDATSGPPTTLGSSPTSTP